MSTVSSQEKDNICNFIEETTEEIKWEDKLIATLKKMDPFAFERLAQRLLREAGFANVEVTKNQVMAELMVKVYSKLQALFPLTFIFNVKDMKELSPLL